METKVATVEMLDEVSKDMRLEWPGRRPRGQRSRVRRDFRAELLLILAATKQLSRRCPAERIPPYTSLSHHSHIGTGLSSFLR